nr:hypothetical protein [uncultured Oscillibacter sp.]
MSDMEKVLEMLTGMNQRMDAMQGDVAALRGEMAALQKDMAALQKDTAALQKDTAALQKDMVTKEELQQAKGDMMALMEAYFTPKFNLLADQIKLTQEKQAPMEALEQTEDRLDVLEVVVKSHSEDIRRLKKAQ